MSTNNDFSLPVDIQVLEIPLQAQDWKYLNEGADHIIVAYCGRKSNELLCGKVLRLKKKTNRALEGELRSFLFIRDTLTTLIGAEYVHCGELVKITPEFQQKLSENIVSKRPPARIVHTLNYALNYGVLMPDFTQFSPKDRTLLIGNPIFTIEFKPKWGTLPVSHFIKKKNESKFNSCRFCMHQIMKFKQKSIQSISSYCPILFFSGEYSKIKHSIKCLFQTPQNNVKVYKDDSLIFGGTNDSKSLECDGEELSSSLNVSFVGRKDLPFAKNKDSLDLLIEILTSIFLEDHLLFKLKQVQQMDSIDIEGIFYLYQKLNGIPISDDDLVPNSEQLDALSKEESEKLITDFLTAATIKDCSVMVTLSPIQQTNEKEVDGFPVLTLEESEYAYIYRLALVDLDPKSKTNIQLYYNLDQSIVRVFSEQQNKKVCS